MSAPVTPEVKNRALELWRDGLSSTVIARRLGPGYTRNQVIGWVARAGATRSADAAKASSRQPKPRPPKPRQPAPRPPRPAPPREAKPNLTGLALVAQMDAPVTQTDGLKTLADRGRHECAWPVGGAHPELGQLYCARPVTPGRPYCAEHGPADPKPLRPLKVSEPDRRRSRPDEPSVQDLLELLA